MKRLEVTIRENLIDFFAEAIKRRVKFDLNISLDEVRTKRTYAFDINLTSEELERARNEIFIDPEVDVSSFEVIEMPYDFLIHITWKPGVTDTNGRVSVEALGDLLKRKLSDEERVYTSLQILLKGNLTKEEVEKIARLYANETVQDMQFWSKNEKVNFIVPKIDDNTKPTVDYINLNVSDESLLQISTDKKLALNMGEMKAIQSYYQKEKVIKEREAVGMKISS